MGKELVRRKMIEYVLMELRHISQIADLEKVCFSGPWSEHAIHAELTNPLSLWIVATEDEKVVGYVGSQSVLGEADMMNIAVLPEYRRRGVARNLVDTLIMRLASEGVHCLTLEVRASNLPATSLYLGMGFQQVGVRPNYYSKPREDALILRKEWVI